MLIPAYWARGAYNFGRGADARGEAYIRDTSAEQLSGMREYFKESIKDLTYAISIKKDIIHAYAILITINMALGDKDKCKELYEISVQTLDTNIAGRIAYMRSLRPRWGGSQEEMSAFLEEVRPYYNKNAKLRIFGGFNDAEIGNRYLEMHLQGAGKEIVNEVIMHFDKALSHGERSILFHSKATALSYLGKHKEALEQVNKALENKIYYKDALELRISSNQHLKNYEDIIKDSKAFLLLDPMNFNYIEKLAFSYEKTGDKKRAIENYELMLKKYPDNKIIQRKLSKLNITAT